MRRLVAALGITSSFLIAWFALEEIPLVVIGQPIPGGKIRAALEEPFFRTLNDKSGIKFRIKYIPVDKAGYRDTHQLQLLKEGKADLISLRFAQNSELEPLLEGIDMAGMITSFEEAREVAAAYSSTVDKQLQERFKAKLLGIWTFGPQEIFCSKPVKSLQDLRGLRVRTSSQQMSVFIAELGAKPAVIDFGETTAALRDNLVDCGITSKASAQHAGWSRYAMFNYPFAIQFGLNGYAITLAKWKSLTRDQQEILQAAFDEHTQDMWAFSKKISDDAKTCHGSTKCIAEDDSQARVNPVNLNDRALARRIMQEKVLPRWEKRCKLVKSSCRSDWDQRLQRLINKWATKETHSNT